MTSATVSSTSRAGTRFRATCRTTEAIPSHDGPASERSAAFRCSGVGSSAEESSHALSRGSLDMGENLLAALVVGNPAFVFREESPGPSLPRQGVVASDVPRSLDQVLALRKELVQFVVESAPRVSGAVGQQLRELTCRVVRQRITDPDRCRRLPRGVRDCRPEFRRRAGDR
jgi:hypothetical protein